MSCPFFSWSHFFFFFSAIITEQNRTKHKNIVQYFHLIPSQLSSVRGHSQAQVISHSHTSMMDGRSVKQKEFELEFAYMCIYMMYCKAFLSFSSHTMVIGRSHSVLSISFWINEKLDMYIYRPQYIGVCGSCELSLYPFQPPSSSCYVQQKKPSFMFCLIFFLQIFCEMVMAKKQGCQLSFKRIRLFSVVGTKANETTKPNRKHGIASIPS